MKIGVLGGSFDPPHFGHILLTFYALSDKKLDKIIVVPCFKHPFGKKLSDYKHRYKMCELAFSKFKNLITVSDIEKKLGGVSRTIVTLEALSEKYKKDRFFTIVGSDILKEKNNWFKIDEIEKRSPFIVIPRGRQKEGFYIPNIKSRTIRKRLKSGKKIENFVTDNIAKYILRNSLYK